MTYPKAAFRCIAKKDNRGWTAECLDLSITVTAADFTAAQGVLGHRIDQSIRGTLTSTNRDEAMALTKKRGTAKDAMRFLWLRILSGIPFFGRKSESFVAIVSLDPRLFVPNDALASVASSRAAAAA